MRRDLHVWAAGCLLLASGLPLVLLGLLLLPTGALLGTTEPEFVQSGNGLVYGSLVGLMECLLVGGMGATAAVAGGGVLLGRRWGWALAVSLAGMTLLSGCAPFSAYLLYALLREPTRNAFGVR